MGGGAGSAHAPPLNPFLPIRSVAGLAPPPPAASSASAPVWSGSPGAPAPLPPRREAEAAEKGPGQPVRHSRSPAAGGAERGRGAQPLRERPPAPGLLTKAGRGRNEPSQLSKSLPAQSRADGGSREENVENKERQKARFGGWVCPARTRACAGGAELPRPVGGRRCRLNVLSGDQFSF